VNFKEVESMTSGIRKEMDSLGEVDVAADMLWAPVSAAPPSWDRHPQTFTEAVIP
jgi:hypothetical protein